MTVELHHATADCVGTWRLQGSGPLRVVRCDVCEVADEATPERRLAAIDENCAGIYLRRLTAQGAAMLEGEK